MPTALIGLGSNVGDRRATLNRAVERLHAHEQITVLGCSQWMATAPVGGPAGQREFLNGAAKVESSLEPAALHQALHEVERELGRTRGVRWDERIIDLDLLLYDFKEIETSALTVPHPAMAFRRFVLTPAAEVAPSMVHPGLGKTMTELLHHLNTAVPYCAVTGLDVPSRRALARRLAERFDRRLISDPCAELAAASDYNPASLDFPGQLELLERRSTAIRDAAWLRWDNWTVSDFWIGENRFWLNRWILRELAERVVRDEPLAELEEQWQSRLPELVELELQAMAPKLLIEVGDHEMFHSQVKRELVPQLTLKSADPEQQFAEAEAALIAMS